MRCYLRLIEMPGRASISTGKDVGMEPVQEKIEKAKRELEQMIDLNPQVMLLVDTKGCVTRANKALLALLGLTDYPQVLGKRMDDLFPGNGDVSRLMVQRKENREIEAEVALAGDRRHVLRFTIVGADAEGELAVIMVSDVGAEKDEAESLAIRHKTEAVKAVAGALMHNVNQSLTIIMVNAQLMNLTLEKGGADPSELMDRLKDVVKETISIADVLKAVDGPARFVTEPYPGCADILDIKKSASTSGGTVACAAPSADLWLESSYAAAIDMLLLALDAHDSGSFLHAKRTAEYAVIIARHMGYGVDELSRVLNCATLHDIGKLGIPDAILCKPGPLSDEEDRLAKTHPEVGYNLLRHFPFAREESVVARSHHERWDGLGYPQALAGKEIHPIARIVSVANCFDTLRAGRQSRQAASVDTVATEINSRAGSHFDPEVIQVFNRCLKELERVSCVSGQ